MGWRGHHHIPSFVDPDDREPYWTRHHRTIDEAQDDWQSTWDDVHTDFDGEPTGSEIFIELKAVGVGSAGEARPSHLPSAVTEPDLLAPVRAGSPVVDGAHSHSQPQEES
jgi:hypothetical protein